MQREQVDPRRVVFLAGVLTFSTKGGASQLRDSDGFSPCFPRFHQRLIPAETRQTNLGERSSLDLLCWRRLELRASQGSDTFCTGKREIRQTAGAIQAEA